MPDGVKVTINGYSQAAARIDSIKAALDVATRQAVNEVGGRLQANAVGAFNTPPSPYTRTGNLQRSIKQGTLIALGAGRYTITVAPHAIYARIQEFGGTIAERRAGQKAVRDGIAKSSGQFIKRDLVYPGSHLTTVTIKPHPYFHPAFQRVKSQARSIFASAWRKALNG